MTISKEIYRSKQCAHLFAISGQEIEANIFTSIKERLNPTLARAKAFACQRTSCSWDADAETCLWSCADRHSKNVCFPISHLRSLRIGGND